ncbi:BTB/POZ and MATH domain-containing protein 2-like [Hordeum vulgare subsp. vulgare]|uniref:BTB/POZ and MATH domain-containing protein 2-like n=1 Tax=Hordeum vulgare subsp. vulgare TaxID=112509 RepID=UPI001D1A51FF|nr:BTB/POZ and MATH domain-containing protein 2-like [Hordeum vulgare subsp. vulgare]
MSSFAGVTVLDGNNRCHCEMSGVHASTDVDTGYHLLIIKACSRINGLVPTGQNITCGPFVIGGHEWVLDYYPNGENPSCADYISVYLTLLYDADVDREEPVEAKFSFSLINQVEKQMPVYIRGTKTYSFSSSAPMWGISKFVRRDVLEQSMDMACDCFTIRCDIMVCEDPKTKDDAGGTLPDIHQHFSNLLDNKLGADVTFEVGGETFAAHRCVLAAPRSTVFRAQLFGPMKEGTATSSIIQIKDMEAEVFRALLSFVYTDSFPEMYKDIMEENRMIVSEEQEQADEAVDDEMSETREMELQWLHDLLVAADRYDLQRLKFICEKRISERIGVSSVASSLALAEKHRCRGLKEACLEFIQVQSPSRLKRVMATSGWEHIMMTYPSVLNEFIAKLISSKRK